MGLHPMLNYPLDIRTWSTYQKHTFTSYIWISSLYMKHVYATTINVLKRKNLFFKLYTCIFKTKRYSDILFLRSSYAICKLVVILIKTFDKWSLINILFQSFYTNRFDTTKSYFLIVWWGFYYANFFQLLFWG